MTENKPRKLHYDLLRIIAAFSVVVLHCSAQFWYRLDIQGTEWFIANAYNALFRFGVPIFVMISGALFLAPDYRVDMKRLFCHNIARMLVVYVIWSCIYGLYNCRDIADLDVKAVLRAIIEGHYHLWFIPMIIGFYLLVPILKSWIEKAEQRQVEYFLVLFVVLQIIRMTLRNLVVSDELHSILDRMEIEMASGYLGYFVLGYYLAHVGIGEQLRRVLYVLFVPAAVLNVVVSTMLTRRAGTPDGLFFDAYGICTFVMVAAMFTFAVDKVGKATFGKKSSALIRELSADTLGIYLLHVGMLEIWRSLGLHSLTFPMIVSVPLLSILCFVVCAIIAGLLRRIPLIGKYMC